MTSQQVKDFAKMLDGRERGSELSEQESLAAQKLHLVIVFGYSDDNMELRGAIDDEVGCYDGGFAYITRAGLAVNECDRDYCVRANKESKTIEALWDKETPFAWTYKTDISHETFIVYDDGDKFCRGIVFDLRDVTQ